MRPVSFYLISDSYPPVLGGSEVEAQRISVGMLGRGHQVKVLCAGGPPMPELRHWVDPEGVPVEILTRHSRGRWKDIVFAVEVAWRLWRDRNRYELVYFLMQGLHLATGLWVARLLGKPIVMKFGGSGVIPLMRASRVGKWELEWLKRWASRLMVLNEGMVREAVEDGFRRDQLYWMPNPTDVAVFAPAEVEERSRLRAERELASGAPVVLYVGRLAPEKGLKWLVEGFAQAWQAEPRAVLVLLGDGPLRAELEQQARGLGMGPETVRMPGRVRPVEVALWLKAADVFALTSPSEGFSCALAEAMSCGLASVVSDIEANSQLVQDGVEGRLVAVGDTAGIGVALGALLSSEAVRREMGHAARLKIVENYSLNKVVDRYEELFAEILVAGK
jgi:glycosyltransferase involved in cell wall biosynthesis